MSRGRTETVVLWHGQYCNDGRDRLEIIERHERTLFGLRHPRLVGKAGDWRVVADATVFAAGSLPEDREPERKVATRQKGTK